MAMRWRRGGWLGWVVGACAFVGCRDRGPGPKAAPTFPGVSIRIGAVGDPALAATVSSALVGEWSATRRAEAKVLPGALDPKALTDCDVILFPADRLGDLIDARALAVLPEKRVLPPAPPVEEDAEHPAAPPPDPLQFAEILPAYRDQVSKYGKDRMALPYGGSALVLVYDRAAFERPENRAAAEKEKLVLGPPKTWAHLEALAKFFQGRDWDGNGTDDHGVAFATANDPERLAAAIFLARAASPGQHRDQYAFLFDSDTMAPRIDSPPFVEALQGFVALRDCGPTDLNAEAARAAFRAGKTALLIDRAERASSWGRGKPIGVAPLPGSDRVYDPARRVWETVTPVNQPSYLPDGGGWLVGVARALTGARREAALDFAKYLIGPEVAGQVRADPNFPMLPIRSATIGQGPPDPRGVDPKQWSDAVGRTLAASRVVPGLRIPEADAYLDDLMDAWTGLPPKEALHLAAEKWSARTKALGVERQLWHYRRSLNALSTTSEPPHR